ncbi:HNH endonuclease domain protein [Escherichia coli MA6]|nr:HNH endonuclease domain protein [Escherichia coli MA6]
MIWQPEFTDKTLSRKPGAVHGVGTGLACIASSPRFCGFRNNLTGQSWYGGSRELGRLLGFVVAYVLQ